MGHVLQMVKQGILASIGWDNTSRRRNAFPEGRRFSHVRLCVTPWTIACQAPMSTGFSRQEYWSGLLFPSPGDLPDPGIKPVSLTSPAVAGGFFTTSTTWEALNLCLIY